MDALLGVIIKKNQKADRGLSGFKDDADYPRRPAKPVATMHALLDGHKGRVPTFLPFAFPSCIFERARGRRPYTRYSSLNG